MPGQKNSGNKGRKRESGIAVRHKTLITALTDDLRSGRNTDGVYIGRVMRKLGNGRVEVFYVTMEIEKTFDKDGNDIEKAVPHLYEKQATIPGRFTGRGKHSVWVEIGGIVVISDTGLGIMEIVGTLTQEQLVDISKSSFIDERVLKPFSKEGDDVSTGNVEFTNEVSDADIDDI